MNIFTNDDYRRIQAWLKANAIKDSEFAISENTIPDKDILIITQNMSTVPTNCKIKIKDLLNSSLGKVVIDKITANIVKVNNSLTVDASKVILNNEKGTTLQDVFNYFEDNKLNRHTDNTFDGNLTVKKNITIEGNIKSNDDTITVEADLEATGEITDGQGNMLSDVNDASKGWKIEYQDPQQDEPTVRAKYVLKDYRGVPKGNVIKIYKDSAITNVYLGTVEDTCNLNTGEVTKHPIHDNNEALSIVYRLDTGKYSLVNVPIKMFVTEAEFDKYKGLGVTENGQVFIKLASDIESSNYLHFNELGEITADGIETRILKDLGNIITSVAGDKTMWGQYKKEEGTKDSPINEASRWGQYKQAESDRSELLNIVSSKVNQLEQAVSNEHSERTATDTELLKRIIGKSTASSAYTDPFKYIGNFASEKDENGTITKHAIRVMQDYLLDTLRHSDFRDSFPYIGHMRAHIEGVPIEMWTYVKAWNTGSTNGVFVQVVRTNFGLKNGVITSAPKEAVHEYFRTVTVGMANGSVTDVTATPWKESTVTEELYSTLMEVEQRLVDESDITSSTEARFYDATGVSIGSTYAGKIGVSSVFECQKITVNAGDKYHIKTYDNTYSARAYILTNSSDVVLALGASSGITDLILQIEQNGTLYLSSWKDRGFFVIKINDVIKRLDNDIQDINGRIAATNTNLSSLSNYEKSKRHSTLLEHLYNPAVTTKIKLFGDSVTHGMGSSDYSATGELIPYANAMRNVGVKSYAAIFANQILENYSEIPINIFSSKFITKVPGSTTYDGRFFTTNLSKTLVQFEFYGTYFYLSYVRLTNNGGKFKIMVDDVENTIIDTSLEIPGGKIKIDNLNDGHHTIKFVGTGESSVTTSTSYISFDFVILPKKIEIINNGVSGYKTKAIVGLVQLLTDSTDNFVTIMGGLNDREYGGAGETLSSFIGIAEWARTNRNFELIYLTPNPASQISSKQFENVTQVSRAVKAAADYEDIQCVDIYNYITKYCVENNKVLKDICPDNLHPNDFVHKLISDYLLLNLGLAPNFIN